MPKYKLLYCYIAILRKKQYNNGFSIIELMVVISLFGISASLITASYLSFERNQRIKSAASQFKNDFRLVQNSATSGNKDVVGAVCNPSPITSTAPRLAGWYLIINSTTGSNMNYVIGGDCLTSAGEIAFLTKTIQLPKDIVISEINYANFVNPGTLGFLFRPLSSGVSVHNSNAFSGGNPDFYDGGGLLHNCISSCTDQGDATITLSSSSGKTYQLKIRPTGEVNEVNP